MCWVGCFASKLCSVLLLIVNTLLMLAYFISMLVECGKTCYQRTPHNIKRSPLLTSVIGPALLFLCGYITIAMTWYRFKDRFDGCHNVGVAIWTLILFMIVVLNAWNAYNVIFHNLGHNSAVFMDMVYAVVIWNIVLMLISCNVGIRNEEHTFKKSGSKMNYRTIEEDVFDHDQDKKSDMHQL
uniref:Uncharacterized protein n=1 Tax=Elphidium margaritaceum TaxID=933848 RepID=A0A7S0TDG8_9EUKA|mmetsp:Transcript_48/g.73  ORF Transcript_48/g.73 Transcript_48/m.73 type:complete len:183 (+) Transcript_48:67-615(+)